MRILTYIDKRRGFLFITTLVITLIIFLNLLIGYRIIFRRGERVGQIINRMKIDELRYNLETLTYSELRRIDEGVNIEKYESGAEYIGYIPNIERVWFGDTNSRKSINGYSVKYMKMNDRDRFYVYKEGEFADFKQIIRTELYRYARENKVVGIELEKIIINEESGEKIYFLTRVNLSYKVGVTNPLLFDKEVLKDFEVGIKK